MWLVWIEVDHKYKIYTRSQRLSTKRVKDLINFILITCWNNFRYIGLNKMLLKLISPVFLWGFFWLHWVFVAARGPFLVAASGGYSLLQCTGFSLQWLLLLWSTGSRRVSFSSCGSWALGAQASVVVARGLSGGLRARWLAGSRAQAQ